MKSANWSSLHYFFTRVVQNPINCIPLRIPRLLAYCSYQIK